jgi:hypothetical protein
VSTKFGRRPGAHRRCFLDEKEQPGFKKKYIIAFDTNNGRWYGEMKIADPYSVAALFLSPVIAYTVAGAFGHHLGLTPLRSACFTGMLLNIVAALFLLAEFFWDGRRNLSISKQEKIVLAGLFACSFLLRWLVPYHTLIHENHHGFLQFNIRTLEPETYFYGALPSSSMFLQHLFGLIFPHTDEGVFLFNAILSSSAVPGAYVFARKVFDSVLAAWTSAVLLMFLPVAIAMAPTEEFMVTAAGMVFWGGAFIWSGNRSCDRGTLLLGVLLVCLASSVRDVAVVLGALIPVLIFASEGMSLKRGWRFWTGWLMVPVLLLGPRAVTLILGYISGSNVPTPGLTGFPSIWKEWWLIALSAPFIPVAMGILTQLSLIAMVVNAKNSRQWQPAFAIVVFWLITVMEAGIVKGGYFPCHLRHHYLSFSFMVLPVGWMWAKIIEKASNGRALVRITAFSVPALAGLTLLLLNMDGAIIDTVAVQEYRFFREGVGRLESKAQVIVLERNSIGLDPFEEGWLRTIKPEWEFIKNGEWLKGERGNTDLPTYVLLDRTCFTDLECHVKPEKCEPFLGSPFGSMIRHCHELITDGKWRSIAVRGFTEITEDRYHGSRVQNHDMLPRGKAFTLAIIKME